MALGLAHGPAEVLPISSSAHTTLIAWLAGWSYAELDPQARKSFEVALHAGTAAALLVVGGRGAPGTAGKLDGRRAALIGLSVGPPALAGYLLEDRIAGRLGTPGTIAAGLVAGSVAMVVGDRRGARGRRAAAAGPFDGLVLGLAQACALVPGVSRHGATLAAARTLGFDRRQAEILSRWCGLPITLGAVGLRLGARSPGPGLGGAGAAGALASFVSTLAAGSLLLRAPPAGSLTPWAAYRIGLAAVVIRRLRKNGADGRRLRRGRG